MYFMGVYNALHLTHELRIYRIFVKWSVVLMHWISNLTKIPYLIMLSADLELISCHCCHNQEKCLNLKWYIHQVILNTIKRIF